MTTAAQDNTEIIVRRDGDRDLEFRGVLLGSGAMKNGTWRGTNVDIYRTASGRYVMAVRAWTQWQGEHDSHRAAVCDTPEEVLAWLRQDAGGALGPASKGALEEAAGADPGLAAVLTERIG